MKLKSSKDKKVTRRKMILISLGIVTIVGVSLLLYKTFASFSKKANLDNNVLFGFYNGEEKLSEMPQKGNSDNLVFEKAVCDNGASVEWDNEKWAPLVKGLTKTKTKCTLYFTEKVIRLDKDISLAKYGQDGLYAVEHNNLKELDSSWNKTEYRYVGVDPNNYVEFNGEKWRIIGLVNVKTESGLEQRIKIIRTDGISGQTNFGLYAWDRSDYPYTNNWTTSKLKDMLNGIYYNSGSGECATGRFGTPSSQNNCDFSTGENLPKGLDDTARKMIDREVIWNIGGWNTSEITADTMYEKERGTTTPQNGETMEYYPAEWAKKNDEEYHNGIGLMYASDYGYAVGGEVRNICLGDSLNNYTTNNCYTNDWLRASSEAQWLLSPYSMNLTCAFLVRNEGYVDHYHSARYAYRVWPAGYLSPSVTIYDGDGSISNPFKLKVD